MAVTTSSLIEEAKLVVDVCMSVEAGDNVTIICDDDHREHASVIADTVAVNDGLDAMAGF